MLKFFFGAILNTWIFTYHIPKVADFLKTVTWNHAACLLHQKYDLILEQAIKAGMVNAKSEKAICKQRAFDEKYDV